MDVLLCLVDAQTGIATKQHIIDTVWKADYVSDQVVAQAITELRSAFEDNARHPSVIETIPRRGYRLMTPAREIELERPESSRGPPSFSLVTDDHEYALHQGSVVIGRATDATIQIDRTEVSRRHARITVEGTTATVEDLGSKNGTFLRGRRLTEPARLVDADEIQIGVNVARFRFVVRDDRTKTEDL
jgi:DNA-binding winged helix-turn-helix (wHTH) protein